MPAARFALLLCLMALLPACSGTRAPRTFAVAPGVYDAAFEASKEVLRSYRFRLNRVDAAEGVITTHPKGTAGLATPWDAEQSGLHQEWEDLLNKQEREVVITFAPQTGDAPGADQAGSSAVSVAPAGDLRFAQALLVAHVEVVVLRTNRSGWRPQARSIVLSSATRDPALIPRGMAGTYSVPSSRDPQLAARIAEEIGKRMGDPSTPRAAN